MMGDDSKTENDPFPVKLYDLLEKTNPRVVSWLPDGNGFTIHDPHVMCAQVLPRFFRHDRLPSFQRQLNLYGFRRVVKGAETGAYRHTLFLRGRPDLLSGIRRPRVRKASDKPAENSGGGDAAAESSASATTARGGARGGGARSSSSGRRGNGTATRNSGRRGDATSAEDTNGQVSKPLDTLDVDDKLRREAGCAAPALLHLQSGSSCDEVRLHPSSTLHSSQIQNSGTPRHAPAGARGRAPRMMPVFPSSCDRSFPQRANDDCPMASPLGMRHLAVRRRLTARASRAVRRPLAALVAALVLIDAVNRGGRGRGRGRGDDDDDDDDVVARHRDRRRRQPPAPCAPNARRADAPPSPPKR